MTLMCNDFIKNPIQQPDTEMFGIERGHIWKQVQIHAFFTFILLIPGHTSDKKDFSDVISKL